MRGGTTDSLSAGRRNQTAVVPVRLVDRLSAFQLPAGQINPAGPGFDDIAPEAIRRDDAVGDAAIAQRIDQTLLRSKAVAGSAFTIASTVPGQFRCVDTEESKADRAAPKCVAVYNVGIWARDGVERHLGDPPHHGVVDPVILVTEPSNRQFSRKFHQLP